jgi:hypothetical protein
MYIWLADDINSHFNLLWLLKKRRNTVSFEVIFARWKTKKKAEKAMSKQEGTNWRIFSLVIEYVLRRGLKKIKLVPTIKYFITTHLIVSS